MTSPDFWVPALPPNNYGAVPWKQVCTRKLFFIHISYIYNWGMRVNNKGFTSDFFKIIWLLLMDKIHVAHSETWLYFPPHFTWWLGQFSELQLRNSAAHREGLWMINWSPFSMCPYRVTCLFPHCQAWSWWQSSCSCSRLSLGPSRHALPCPALPASQLSQYLRCSHHPNVTKRPLQPRMGSCLDTGELAKQTHVSACTCQYKCPLRLLAICGADKSTAQRGKGKHSDKLYGLGGDSALTKFKEQVLQCPPTETKTR